MADDEEERVEDAASREPSEASEEFSETVEEQSTTESEEQTSLQRMLYSIASERARDFSSLNISSK